MNLKASTITFLKTKMVHSASISYVGVFRSSVSPLTTLNSSTVACRKNDSSSRRDTNVFSVFSLLGTGQMSVSLSLSACGSTSLYLTMLICDSPNKVEVEYIDNHGDTAVASVDRKACNNFDMPDQMDITSVISILSGNIYQLDLHMGMEINDETFDNKERPSTNFMYASQKDINARLHAILIDSLVEVADEYRLVPYTLYPTENHIDRYLSGYAMNRRLQLLGVGCVMIAVKSKEICAPQVEEFCYITDNTDFKEEVLQMDSGILNFLKSEMTAPTAKCFPRQLRSFD